MRGSSPHFHGVVMMIKTPDFNISLRCSFVMSDVTYKLIKMKGSVKLNDRNGERCYAPCG